MSHKCSIVAAIIGAMLRKGTGRLENGQRRGEQVEFLGPEKMKLKLHRE